MLASVEVYKKLAPKLGEQEASDLIVFIEDSVKQAAVTKADLERTARELENNFNDKIANLETGLRKEIADLRSELKSDIAAVETGLRKEITDLRSELKSDTAVVETGLRKEIAEVRKEIAEIRKEVSDLRGLLIKFILPMSSLIGAVAGAVIQIITK